MKIRQIELIGFKSFADKISLSLHDGITCIVGPNGCGKSNVVDSFRWVLGEQSAKSLRGERMEEVIFQGTATKKQRGMAEVTLLLSQTLPRSHKEIAGNGNGNGESSDDASSDEIIVTRRLYRSGESEYLLNRRQCRLKDIRDIFLDTGLDVKSYSILDQGRITEILNTKPQEKRFLIEEVAGVMKYKVRKAEALSKLDSSKQNLQRINDIVYEVKRQMNSLDRQVKKAERYKRLYAELMDVDLRIAKREHNRLSEGLTSVLSEIEKLREADSARRSELSAVENAIETKRIEIVEKEKALLELEGTIGNKGMAIAETEKRIAVLKTQIENRKAGIARLMAQREDDELKGEDLLGRAAELETRERELTLSIDSLSSDLGEKRDWLSSIERDLAAKEEAIEGRRKALFRLSEDLSNKRNEVSTLQSSRENLKYRESASRKDIDAVREGIRGVERSMKESEEAVEAGQSEQMRLQSELEACRAHLLSLRDRIEQRRNDLSQERESLASNLARFNSLKELIVDASLLDILPGAEGVSAPSKAVLSDIISAESDLDLALEAALSERINALIVERTDELTAVLTIIKDKQLGRTSIFFTPLQQASSSPPARIFSVSHPSVVGRAADLIRFEGPDDNISPEVRDVMQRLLGKVCIVNSLEAAIEIQRDSAPDDVTLVTLGGEVITPDGFIFAGQGKQILKRKREIKALQALIARQHRTIRDHEQEAASLSEELSTRKEEARGIEVSLVDTEKRLSLAHHMFRDQKDELERKTRKQTFLESELSVIASEQASLAEVIESGMEELRRQERGRDAVNDEISSLQQALITSRNEYEEARSHFTDMKLSVSSCREKIEAVRKERETIEGLIAETDHRKASALTEVEEIKGKIDISLAELRGLDEGLRVYVAEMQELRDKREKEKEGITEENQLLIASEGGLKKIRAEIDVLSQQLAEANTRAVEIRLTREHIETAIAQKYDQGIGTAEIGLEGFDPSEDEQRISQLHEKVRDLGPVNLGTIEEYEDLKNRYDFLSKQQQDLTMSIAELEEAIGRINTTTRRRLREAYDALRTKFSEVFITLFGGGRADIVLTDEENILESGIEVIAQPPGKKLQNLSLLSGGEKALTSLALLFAGFLIKPSPLCIMDEVDAPLDESNTVRFAEMIKGLSRDTQFIVITHNKTTMEVADYLYGITMEEAGLSKVISLQFSEL